MKEIILTQRKVALVDDADYDWLNQYNWHAHKNGRINYYAGTSICVDGKWDKVWMHRIIMNCPKDMQIDHKDRKGLNNQRDNLRICSRRQNLANREARGSSGYLGVTISAHISISKKQHHLGNFKTAEDAARAYDKAAKIHHGEFANLNFK